MADVLVVGSGAREHIFAQTFLKSPHVNQVFVAPGNPGMQTPGITPVALTTIPDLVKFAQDKAIALTFVGAEKLLAEGLVDAFEAANLPVFGPTQAAAQLESSKAFTKKLLHDYKIPTAMSQTTHSLPQAQSVLAQHAYPVVIKLDGLALGKGVHICQTAQEANTVINAIYTKYADAVLVIEDYLEGVEYSIFSFVGPKQVVHTPVAQDHKRLLDHDKGPNTGGMGAYSPVRWLSEADIQTAINQLVMPVLSAMEAEALPFRGVLYTGVMQTAQGPKVIEYNVRFGDPEAQVVLPQLQSDLFENLLDLQQGRPTQMHWQNQDVYLGVTLAAPGYPEQQLQNLAIPTLPNDIQIDYAGVTKVENTLVSRGGRVLTAVSHDKTATEAQAHVYAALNQRADDFIYRRDIGQQAVAFEKMEGL
ncbi:phosphoribosylamine--glycine ligase [Weissella uvarum]|uniref:phosphoribosylamine--glycine ligase n=1 Tax=Weissella uvarum TaxID=1479233 RepID=UPI00195F2A50|nr:phosphoribosylamine--glycine ligase [Weissella uvarum]MBM7617490.1 phosphoribosylamine--glycine ligase [Weissella uvarum]MCM0595626.1 phosphoribosylamine--glycine ligase [Weissella uvarum]